MHGPRDPKHNTSSACMAVHRPISVCVCVHVFSFLCSVLVLTLHLLLRMFITETVATETVLVFNPYTCGMILSQNREEKKKMEKKL